jgi:hypothetical protein
MLFSCHETISSYDEWFNAKYGNWFDDKKYGEQHQKWRGKTSGFIICSKILLNSLSVNLT